MRIQYTLAEKDLLEAQQAQLGWAGRTLPVIGGLLILSAVYTLAHDPRQIGTSVAGIAIGACLAFGFRMLVSYTYKRDKRLHDRFVAIPTDEGIEVSSSHGSSKFAWGGLTKHLETKSLFLLYQGPVCVNIIPKNSLGAGEADAFRQLIQEKLNAGGQMERKGLSPKTWIFIVVVSVSFVLMLLTIRNALRQPQSTPRQTQSTN